MLDSARFIHNRRCWHVPCWVLNKERNQHQRSGGNIMGIFSRLSDIISSNINAMLDRAEDPEKLIRLMIQEMEDTLVEIKASCAGVMATKKRVHRELDEVVARAEEWAKRAQLAM